MFLGGEGRDLIFVFFVYRLLQNNNINGLIPAEIGKLTKLKTLDLSSNHFSGEIPSSAGHLESLQYL
jgi:Leucine-rich repeat (LRR) protein